MKSRWHDFRLLVKVIAQSNYHHHYPRGGNGECKMPEPTTTKQLQRCACCRRTDDDAGKLKRARLGDGVVLLCSDCDHCSKCSECNGEGQRGRPCCVNVPLNLKECGCSSDGYDYKDCDACFGTGEIVDQKEFETAKKYCDEHCTVCDQPTKNVKDELVICTDCAVQL